MSINWIHITITAPAAELRALDALLAMKLRPEAYQLCEEGSEPHLVTESLDVEAVMDCIAQASAAYPAALFGIRYCASLPGAYHEIIGTCSAGNITVNRDTVDRILAEDAEEGLPNKVLIRKAVIGHDE